MQFENDSADVPQDLSILKEIKLQSDEDLEERVNRQLQDEQFTRREERRKANIHFKETDEMMKNCFPELAIEMKKREKEEIEKEMKAF